MVAVFLALKHFSAKRQINDKKCCLGFIVICLKYQKVYFDFILYKTYILIYCSFFALEFMNIPFLQDCKIYYSQIFKKATLKKGDIFFHIIEIDIWPKTAIWRNFLLKFIFRNGYTREMKLSGLRQVVDKIDVQFWHLTATET